MRVYEVISYYREDFFSSGENDHHYRDLYSTLDKAKYAVEELIRDSHLDPMSDYDSKYILNYSYNEKTKVYESPTLSLKYYIDEREVL